LEQALVPNACVTLGIGASSLVALLEDRPVGALISVLYGKKI